MLLAGDIQRYRARTSGDQDVSSLELPAFDDNRVSTGETGNPVKSVDAVFGEIPFPIAGNSIGEAAFKHHQVAPINPHLARDAMPAHARLRVDRLRTADQYLLRIAAAKGASPAERTVIDQCYRPPCGTHSRACHLRGSARTDDHEIVGLHDVISSEGSQRVAGNGRRNVKNSTRQHTDITGPSPAFARSVRRLLADAAHIPGEPVVIARPMRCMALAGRLSGRVPK